LIMTDSRRWLDYFRSNQADPEEIPWDRAVPLSGPWRDILAPSLQQFQLGENASGLHFLALAREHARRAGDPDFPEAIALFIAEEQRHSAMLGRYLRSIGAPLLREHWIHSVFRRLRHMVGGLEGKVTVLVTAEILAVPYYRAVMESSRCPALKAICQRVLREEAQHLLFQGNTLRRLQRHRPGWWVSATHLLQEVFLMGTCLATWREHRRVFACAGEGFLDVWFTGRVVLAHVQRAAAGLNPQAYRAGGTTRMPVSQ
jgi:hypothetical protein